MNDWKKKLEYSLAAQQEFDISLLRFHFPKCIKVEKTDVEMDKTGVDYIATLEGGAKILIDAKTREAGASRYWKYNEPELALEIWSVIETKKLGWTLSLSTNVDYILYTFARRDSDKYYILPFQLLNKTFWKNGRKWLDRYGQKKQRSNSWTSSAIFVPASVVMKAISEEMMGDSLRAEEKISA